MNFLSCASGLVKDRVALLTRTSLETGRGLPTPLGIYDLRRAEWRPTGLRVDPFPFENRPFQPLFGFEGDTLVVGVREYESEIDGDTADTIVNAVRLE